MRATVVVLTAACMGGCALFAWTPQDLRDRGTRVEGRTARAPAEAARCISANAENAGGTYSTRVEERPGSIFEVLVRASELGSLAIFDLYASEGGSFVVAYAGNLFDSGPEAAVRSLLRGC